MSQQLVQPNRVLSSSTRSVDTALDGTQARAADQAPPLQEGQTVTGGRYGTVSQGRYSYSADAWTLPDEAQVALTKPAIRDITSWAHSQPDNRRLPIKSNEVVYSAIFNASRGGEVTPGFALKSVTLCGDKSPDNAGKYGKDFVRLALDTVFVQSLVDSAKSHIKLADPPIATVQQDESYTIVNVSIDKAATGVIQAEAGALPKFVYTSLRDAVAQGPDFYCWVTLAVKARYMGRKAPYKDCPYTLQIAVHSVAITEVIGGDNLCPVGRGGAGRPAVQYTEEAVTKDTVLATYFPHLSG